MVKITCPTEQKDEINEWLKKTNREEMKAKYYEDGMYRIEEKEYGFLVDTCDGEVIEWEPDLPDPFWFFRALNKQYPCVGITGYIPYFDFKSDMDFSEMVFSAPGDPLLESEPIDEDGMMGFCFSDVSVGTSQPNSYSRPKQ